MTTIARVPIAAAPRKSFGGHGVPAYLRDPLHVAAAWTYQILCSPKRLAYAWGINVSTARKYGRGAVVGALTRLAWEIVLLERRGVKTTPMWTLLRRAAMRERRKYQAKLVADSTSRPR